MAAPDDAVAENVTGEPVAPLSVAWAAWVPASVPRVHVVLAIPSASEGADGGSTDPPAAEVDQETVTPEDGVPPSVTSTRSGAPSGCPTVPLCASPLFVEVLAIAVVEGGVPVSLPPPPQPATRLATANHNGTNGVRRSWGILGLGETRMGEVRLSTIGLELGLARLP